MVVVVRKKKMRMEIRVKHRAEFPIVEEEINSMPFRFRFQNLTTAKPSF
jgi:hypothetical protein